MKTLVLPHWVGRAKPSGDVALGLGVVLLVAVLVVPLPPWLLDVGLALSFTSSVLVLMVALFMQRPLDFTAFPTVLLLTTLLRLALNVATTRTILTSGHEGPDAAGAVISAFGNFLMAGDVLVGLIVFAILLIVNFMVVTKGSERIAEVSARFSLDAMPGKQMAIDADLNAGLITQDEARARRQEVRTEADFYGSMDGASKFVRGDATAGILILFINIIGGLAIGTMSHDLELGEAARIYVLLTIGDGLVAQIPALLLATAVAVIVTRVSSDQDMGGEVARQLVAEPRLLGVAAGVLALLGVIPGMPNLIFLSMAALAGAAAWYTNKRLRERAAAPVAVAATSAGSEARELSWEDMQPVDLVGLEVGYRLVPLVDKAQGGDLLARIRGVRLKVSQDLGFLVPAVHIRDNLDLSPNAYRIQLSGVPVGEGSVFPDREMAINPGRVFGTLQGVETRDPAFGMDAVWIEPSMREHAQSLGYTVVDASTVIATHLSQLIAQHAHEILGHEEAQNLLNNLAKTAPKLVEDLVPKVLSVGAVVKVLQALLAERVPVRNLRSILEALAEHAGRTQDPQTLVAQVRVALSRQIVQDIAGISQELPVITLDPGIEQLLGNSVGAGGASPGLEPGLAERLQGRLVEAARRQEIAGQPAVLLVPPALRPILARFLRATVPQMHVLAWNEIPDSRRVRLVSTIGN